MRDGLTIWPYERCIRSCNSPTFRVVRPRIKDLINDFLDSIMEPTLGLSGACRIPPVASQMLEIGNFATYERLTNDRPPSLCCHRTHAHKNARKQRYRLILRLQLTGQYIFEAVPTRACVVTGLTRPNFTMSCNLARPSSARSV